MMPQRCPEAETLRRLLGDQLESSEAQTVEAHVETCAVCQGALEELTAGAQATKAWETVPEAVLRRLEASPAGPPGRWGQSQVQALLRKRLTLLTCLTFLMSVFYAVSILYLFPDAVTRVIYAVAVVVTGGLAFTLRSGRPIPPRSLRWMELAFLTAFVGLQTRLHVLFFGRVELAGGDWFSPANESRSISFTWAVLVIGHGLIIPNPRRRAAAVVAVLACWPVVLNVGLCLPGGVTRGGALFVAESAINMAIAATLAVFGAHQFEALREETARARRLGQYQLKRRLGAGGMGEVWLAEHVLLRRPCAVKLIRPEHAGDDRFLRRFEREVKATAALSHPNTVEVYDYGRAEDGTFYYAMEYLPGLSLDELVRQSGPLPPGRAVHLLRQVCGALAEAHAVGLVHRDIKPGNVLVCERGGVSDVAKLLDFGLVRSDNLAQGDATLTELGTIAGTPAYMSPEQARGEVADARSDLYSVGAVAYFLLTGEAPFVRGGAVPTMAAHLSDAVVPPRKHRDVPADVEAVVMQCLEKDPARRFQSAAGLGRALAACARREE